MNASERERLHQEDLQRIRGFRLIDDDFMNVCFDGYIEGTELLLRIILSKPDIKVKSVKIQKVMKNLLGRDIWLDIEAEDADGVDYDIEIQRADKGADFKRARYHSSILDAHLLQPAQDFSELPETYIIFLTENDVIGRGKPLYTVERQITNINEPFTDGEHIVYVNGAYKDSATELGRLMHDFFCTDPEDMHYEQLASKAKYFKQDEKGVKSMCKVLEDMRMDVAKDAAIRFIKLNKLTLEEIASALNLPLDTVKALAETVTVQQ